jgi:hypothetical protein
MLSLSPDSVSMKAAKNNIAIRSLRRREPFPDGNSGQEGVSGSRCKKVHA